MKPKQLSDKDIEDIIKRTKMGYSTFKLAREYNMGVRRLTELLEKNGLEKQFSSDMTFTKIKKGLDIETEDKVIKLRNKKKSLRYIAKKLNLTENVVNKILKKNGIDTKKRFFVPPDFESELIEDYLKGMSQNEVIKKYSTSCQVFNKIMEERGIKVRKFIKYEFDEFYFKKIDTQNKAYFLGLIFADGSVSKTRARYDFAGRMSISLQERDGYVLKKMKEDIKYNGPLYKIERKPPRQDQLKISIAGIELCADLDKLGVKINKTHNCNFPSCIPEDLMHHFIRGFFDGDGGATISNCEGHMKYNVNFIGTVNFITELHNILDKKIKKCVQLADENRKSFPMKIIRIASQKGIEDFYNYIYRDAEVFLERKKEKIEEILNLQIQRKGQPFWAISPEGERFESNNRKEFAEKHGFNEMSLGSLIRGDYSNSKGWKFERHD